VVVTHNQCDPEDSARATPDVEEVDVIGGIGCFAGFRKSYEQLARKTMHQHA